LCKATHNEEIMKKFIKNLFLPKSKRWGWDWNFTIRKEELVKLLTYEEMRRII